MKRLLLALPLALLMACGEDTTGLLTSESGGTVVGPQFATSSVSIYEGNQRCMDLGYDYGFKVDRSGTNVNGTWQVGDLGSITITGNGTSWSWTSTFGIDAALAKGGNTGGNIYRYAPESFGDNGLTQPDNINPNNGRSSGPAAISHVEFCFDIELVVAKTAATTYTRTWSWSIDKNGSTGSLLLTNGQTAPAVNYTVDATSTSIDSDWNATGSITIFNPAPFATSVTSVSDLMTGDIAGAVDCGALPATLGAGATMTCTWSSALPDASSRLNTATVTTDGSIVGEGGSTVEGTVWWGTGPVSGNTATANVTFGAPTTETDESATVTDTRQGTLGTVTGSGHWAYNIVFGPYATCGESDEGNTASYTTNDNGASGSDSWNVHVTVTGCRTEVPPPPVYGCTLTQGYWKTHSLLGNAPYDNNWANLGTLQQNTLFYSSAQTWYGVFWTPPKGNQYYNLAHQFMAARLNVLNGASTTAAVDAALAQAATIFGTTSGVKLSKANTTLATTLAITLAAYNEGATGPGHCSE